MLVKSLFEKWFPGSTGLPAASPAQAGGPPVPSGDSPDGRETKVPDNRDGLSAKVAWHHSGRRVADRSGRVARATQYHNTLLRLIRNYLTPAHRIPRRDEEDVGPARLEREAVVQHSVRIVPSGRRQDAAIMVKYGQSERRASDEAEKRRFGEVARSGCPIVVAHPARFQ